MEECPWQAGRSGDSEKLPELGNTHANVCKLKCVQREGVRNFQNTTKHGKYGDGEKGSKFDNFVFRESGE